MPAAAPAQNALALRDIHLPEPISWWPPAPGWWLLLALLVTVAAVIYAWNRTQQNNREQSRIRNAALAELENIRQLYRDTGDSMQLLRSLSTLLRRVCLSFYPDSKAPGLTGQEWLRYLDSTAPAPGFQSELGKVLATAPYLPEDHCPKFDEEALLALSENWIRAQHSEAALS